MEKNMENLTSMNPQGKRSGKKARIEISADSNDLRVIQKSGDDW